MDEVIVPEGVDLSRAQGMPLIDGHRTDAGIGAILGKIDNVRLENGQIIGEAMFASDHEYRLKDVQRGFYRQGSICADIIEVEWVDRPDDIPLVLITRSLATDYSLVAVGADPNSIIRSADTTTPPKVTVRAAEATTPSQEKTMDLEEIVAAAEAAIAAADAAVAVEGTASELVERVRALRTARAAEDEGAAKAAEEKTDAVERAAEDGETEEDKAETETIRTVARSYGLGKLVDDMLVLRAKPADLRKAVRSAIAERGAAAADTQVVVKPAVQRSVEPINATAQYAARAAARNKQR
ncbi:hypothetical protein HJB51_28980 [Rhizobium lentis]|uniref:hypothetical protein n=1 Tax=Rhizobium lentis TaxID=1138194 RepID=UPI001C82F1EF|nr:hypothetical protein [Rhizobium lentis]MBX5111967.1 hypothetical protein [Rhizobium lentis]